MTMRRMAAVWTVVALAAANAPAWAASSQTLDMAGLKAEAKENRALARYIKLNGYPDVADVKPVIDQSPWDNREVTLYYLGRRHEISFGRARILGHPDVHIMRYERLMTDSDVRALGVRPTLGSDAPAADAEQHATAEAPAEAPAETTTATTAN
jgi:hypothetical protein